MEIVKGDLDDLRVIALLHTHLTSARAVTPPGSAHALDTFGLKAADIDFFCGWEAEQLLVVGALRNLTGGHGEIKSMHVAKARRQGGAGSAMLAHLVGVARSKGMSRLSLETGATVYFKPAVSLYKKHGFEECGAYSDYAEDANSIFMTLVLHPGDTR